MSNSRTIIIITLILEVKLQPLESIATVTEGDNATLCVTVRNGSLQRDILVTVKTVSGITSTGEIV